MNSWQIRLLVCVGLIVGYQLASQWFLQDGTEERRAVAMRQFENSDKVAAEIRESVQESNGKSSLALFGWLVVLVVCVTILKEQILATWKSFQKPTIGAALLLCLTSTGCFYRPFEPNVLEDIGTSEVGFLLPYTGDGTAQEDNNKEEFLHKNMVSVRQIRIPQQWIQEGYTWGIFHHRGSWKPAARLVKVDTAPVTREWTADENSGTSNKKEAVWVMTADQVEFSTGWICTARIVDQPAAVKFLHNYRNDSLQEVMDREVRAKIQTAFALEVTDLPMEKLRLEATPHITKVVNDVTKFFEERGVQITNLGISGGFVYKDASIQATMVRVFNAEQERAVAIAESQAQIERNKTVKSTAEGKAEAIKIEKTAEAEGIKSVADAKAYEIDKAEAKGEMYMALKALEVEKLRLERWNGAYPINYMPISGGTGTTPALMLNIPAVK